MNRRRIALFSTWYLEPADNGRKQRTRQMIAALAGDYDVALIALLPAENGDRGPLRPVPGVWRQWVLPLPVFHPTAANALLAGLSPLPRSLVATWDPGTAAAVSAIARDIDACLAIGTDLRTLRYLLSLPPGIRTILDEPDVSPFVVDGMDGRAGRWRLRAVARERKYRRLLADASRRLDAVVVASAVEAAAYRRLSGSSRVAVLPNGVDAIPRWHWRLPDSLQLLYTGSITYRPNAEAVAYFISHILPHLEKEAPGVRLVVTGHAPDPVPRALRHPRVRYTGRLESLDAVYRESRAFIAPLLSGTGTRVKLLEAMAIGMPIVSTSKGAEGLDIVPGEHLLIADDAPEFAAAITRLLRDRDESECLGAAARALVRQRYTWDRLGSELRGLVEQVLSVESVPADLRLGLPVG